MLFQVLRVGCFFKRFVCLYSLSANIPWTKCWVHCGISILRTMFFLCTPLQCCPFSHPPLVCVLFPNSFLSTVFRKTSHAVFVFLHLADFTPHDALSFPPFPRKWLNLTFSSWLSKTLLCIFFLLISQIFNFYFLGVHTGHSTFSLCIKLMSIEDDSVAWKLWLLLQ